MSRGRLRCAAIAVAGLVGGAVVALFLGGPAVLADGSDVERARTVVAAALAAALVALGIALLAGSLLGGAAIAAGALPVVALLMVADLSAWPVGAALLVGITAGIVAGTAVGIRLRSQRTTS